MWNRSIVTAEGDEVPVDWFALLGRCVLDGRRCGIRIAEALCGTKRHAPVSSVFLQCVHGSDWVPAMEFTQDVDAYRCLCSRLESER